jgi:protein-L-isoaspartate(D-aspartate) O-methyltransferase
MAQRAAVLPRRERPDPRAIFASVMQLDDCRRFYANEIRLLANVGSREVVEAFARVPREKFFGAPPWQIASPEHSALALAGISPPFYVTTSEPRDLCHNVLIAIDAPRHINNGQPTMLARWIDALDLKPGDRAFHLGCGVGYYTAILAEIVGPRGSVLAIDVDSHIAARAKENLAAYPHVIVHSGDGATLDPRECDAMLINAGVTHPHQLWLDRLVEGGRLVLPITASVPGSSFGSGVTAKIVRRDGRLSARVVGHVAIYSCTSIRDPELEVSLRKALPALMRAKLKSVRVEAHEQDDTCLVHSSNMCLSARTGEEER